MRDCPNQVEIQTFTISVRELKTLQQPAQEAIILLGHVANELNFLVRALLGSTNFSEDKDPENNLGWSMLLFFARMHLSKLMELINTLNFIWNSLPASIKDGIDDAHQELINDLIAYKQRTDSIGNIARNRYGFHNPNSIVREARIKIYEDLGDEFKFRVYSDGGHWNTYYFGSELIVMNAMLEYGLIGNTTDSFSELARRMRLETVALHQKFSVVCNQILMECFKKITHGSVERDGIAERFRAVGLESFSLPVFIVLEHPELSPR